MKISNLTKALLLSLTVLTTQIAHAANMLSEKTDKSMEKTGNYLSDSAVTTKIKAKLMATDDLKVSDVNVETNQGIVSLTGSVDNLHSKNQIVNLTRQIKGVKSVEENLTVRMIN